MEASTFRSRSFRRLLIIFGLIVCIYITASNSKIQKGLVPGLAGLTPQDHRMPPVKQSNQAGQQETTSTNDQSNFDPKTQPRLPDIIRIPFEQATKDVSLQGWEDEWFSSATYKVEKFGHMLTPKIDFAYNCKSLKQARIETDDNRGKWFRPSFQ